MASQPDWTVVDLHHLGLTVSDIDRSIVFYRDLLGMEVVGRRPSVTADYVALQTGYPEVELNVASLRVGPHGRPTLELAQYMSHVGEPSEPATNRSGASHLCLVVDDLVASYEALQARGVRFRSSPVTITAGPNQGGLVVYLYDPDGYVLELFQPASPLS
ncbi:MAG: bleomycin resistance protein [Planctomycetaceae bacterium]|nr:bleomycin resistance protein [Planctomycetaceae bacterium]